MPLRDNPCKRQTFMPLVGIRTRSPSKRPAADPHLRSLGQWHRQIPCVCVCVCVCSFTHSITSALDGGEWSAGRSGRLTPDESAFGTRMVRGWLDQTAGLNALKKIFLLLLGLEPRFLFCPFRSTVTVLTELLRLLYSDKGLQNTLRICTCLRVNGAHIASSSTKGCCYAPGIELPVVYGKTKI